MSLWATTTLSLNGHREFNNERNKMSNAFATAIQTTERAFQSQFFAVHLGETLGEAVARHRRAHGVGPLVLMRDYNVAAVACRVRHSVAA